MWVALGAYGLFVLACLIRFTFAFSKPKQGTGPAR
jgi:hypothetical protein